MFFPCAKLVIFSEKRKFWPKKHCISIKSCTFARRKSNYSNSHTNEFKCFDGCLAY